MLEALVAPTFAGHIGTRNRVEHRFGDGDFLATRLTAHAAEAPGEAEPLAVGVNISRWDRALLAEEWAVWEAAAP